MSRRHQPDANPAELELVEIRLASLAERERHLVKLFSLGEELLARACRAVERWLEQADESKRQLALEALQIAVVATREEATVRGVLPLEDPEFFISQRASACTFRSAKPLPSTGVRFSRAFTPVYVARRSSPRLARSLPRTPEGTGPR